MGDRGERGDHPFGIRERREIVSGPVSCLPLTALSASSEAQGGSMRVRGSPNGGEAMDIDTRLERVEVVIWMMVSSLPWSEESGTRLH